MSEPIRQPLELGLADNEARCYAALHLHGAMSGYEIARRSGIARGNVYPSMDRLLSKEAVVRASDDRLLAVLEHTAAEDIRQAQGGRLLVLAACPPGLIGVLGSSEAGAGVRAWNRYVASAIGLYVAHERFLIRLWSSLPEAVCRSARHSLTDLSSRIALAGLVPGMPLVESLQGTVTPPSGQ